jgi:cbb3-type cytochrome oxidase subunit 3
MNSITQAIGRHPDRAAAAMAILIVILIVVIGVAVYYWRKSRKAGFEGLAAMPEMVSGPGIPGGSCGPGETAVSYHNPDGSVMMYCRNTDALPGPPTVCGAGWDPAASAEAEALATVGSLQHEPYGERRLSRAVNAAYDASLGLSDEQLASLMHQGGTP